MIFSYCISTFVHVETIVMLEKSLGLLFYLKKPKDYKNGPVPIYLRITVDGVEKEMSTKRSWEWAFRRYVTPYSVAN